MDGNNRLCRIDLLRRANLPYLENVPMIRCMIPVCALFFALLVAGCGDSKGSFTAP